MNFTALSWKYIKWKIRRTGMKEKLIKFEDFEVQFYDNEKKSPALVLLNGFGASTEFQWYKLLPSLVKKNRVIMVNLLHFGDTKPNAIDNCRIVDQVNLVHELLAQLQIKECRLGGISYGGLIASEFAEKYSPLVSQLILLNAPTKFLDLKKLERILRSNGAETIHDFFAPKNHLGLQAQFRLAYYSSPKLPRFILKSFYKELCEPYRNQWILILNDLLSEYDNLKCKNYMFAGKTTLIWGENDQVIPIDVGRKLNEEYINSSLQCISKCGHLPSIEQSKKVAELMK